MPALAPSRDAEDSPGSVSSKQPLDIHREERRFLIDSGQAQRQALDDRGVPFLRRYEVTTLYMEPRGARTWSIGRSQIKYRLRSYNSEKIWWFEMKTNTEGMVDKHRRQVTPDQIDKLGLVPMVKVHYWREEFETGSDALKEYQEGKEDVLRAWLRVTIDTSVTAIHIPRELPPSGAMRAPGFPIATLVERVLEVKSGLDQVPLWLPLPAEWDGSKSRFAIAADSGMPNRYGMTYNPRNPYRVPA